MLPLSPMQLFELWERGRGQSPALRARALLAAGAGDLAPAEFDAYSVGRRDADLLRLRAATFGRELRSRIDCSACGDALEWSIDVETLLPAAPSVAAHEIALDADGFTLRFRPPTTGDLAAICWHPGSASGVAAAREQLIARCIIAAERGGKSVEASTLSEEAKERVELAMAANDPAAEFRLLVTCSACGSASEALLDIVSYFWLEVEAWVERTAREVHALASAYGWREADVLAMGPARRHLYLGQLAP
jgi:hypothetical protein